MCTLCISTHFVMCLEVVNRYIIKEELYLIINVYSCVFIIDNRGKEELILGRDYRIHFLAMFQTEDISSQLAKRNTLFFSGDLKCGMLAFFRLTQRVILIVCVITTKRGV